MSDPALYEPLGIELLANEPNFGHPNRPNLLPLLLAHRPYRKGNVILTCTGPAEDECCSRSDTSLYLKIRRGVPYFSHFGDPLPPASSGESDKHKALKDRYCELLNREGVEAIQEVRAASGKYVTDLRARHGAVDLGIEFQVSAISRDMLRRRVAPARQDHITPFWISDREDVPFLDRYAPSAQIEQAGWRRISAGERLRVKYGVRICEEEVCRGGNLGGATCPVTKRAYCGRTHRYLSPSFGQDLDRVVLGAAMGDYKVVAVPLKKGGAHYWWVGESDRKRYLEEWGEVQPITPEPPEASAPKLRPGYSRGRVRYCDGSEGPAEVAPLSLDDLKAKDGHCRVCGAANVPLMKWVLPGAGFEYRWLCRGDSPAGAVPT